jgi:hypothetical protein
MSRLWIQNDLVHIVANADHVATYTLVSIAFDRATDGRSIL